MDADWDELRVIPHHGPLPSALPTPISTIAFDTSQELLWIGSTYGRVQSFYGPELQKYTSYIAHAGEAVRQIVFHEKGVISISARHVHMAARNGPSVWHISVPEFVDLYCMSWISKSGGELLVAGSQESMSRVDVEKGVVVDTIPAEEKYKIMRRGNLYICAADFYGRIHIIDPTSLKVVRVWQAHLGVINDMDARADFLVTCGLSQRQQHGLMPDPLANVFDLKSLAPLPPIPFQPGAAFVRMHPKMSTTSIVASQTGQLQVVDIMNPHTVSLKQAHIYDNNYLIGLELAPTGEALALASSMCQVHLWGSPSKLKFAEYSNPTLLPDHIQQGPAVDWSEETPLNTIGMPYYRENLLSSWPNQVHEAGRLPPKIDPQITATMKRGEIGFYAISPPHKRPNQVEYTRIEAQNANSIAPPKFLSEKAREAMHVQEGDRGFTDALSELQLDASKRDVPHVYRNVEIKYSKFGVDDFDFEFYNKTPYSGLETHIANSYANPLLQLYRFTPVLRNLALYHTSTSCLATDCMLCELGFLIDMLEKAAGQNCQATNFLKTFSGLSAAESLHLLEEHSHNGALTAMIQGVNRLLLDKYIADFALISPENTYLDQAIGTKVVTTIRCAHCNHRQMKSDDLRSHNLAYPNKSLLRTRGMRRITFSEVLKASVERQDQMRGWCPSCHRYQQLHTTREIQRVPAVLMLHAAIHSPEATQIWSTPNWLPNEIGIIVEQGQFFCYQGEDLKLHQQRGVYNIQVYELLGVVSEVSSGHNEKPHLVSVINASPSSIDTESENDWYLFNDFLVQPTTIDDALRFDPTWKLPSVMTYQLKSAGHLIDNSWKETMDTTLLYSAPSSATTENPHNLTLLSPTTEAPTPGTHVGIDAEFVSLQSEEIEIKADGTRETVRPSRLGLARVSVLRGNTTDPLIDTPFIDDYIATTEPVIDYLTAFSGIKPGDLAPATSTHALISLKAAYKKLWLLLNAGVIFVGHGLLKDFRTINMHVPRAQVIDTVDLWFIRARSRKLNLRFLAWLLLREDIQSGDAHDSVEDARSALRLWRKYVDVQSQGRTEETLEWVYKRGREVGFRAPSAMAAMGPAVVVDAASGRATPEQMGDGEENLMETPVKKAVFGAERVGFGSPLR
ncbi:hypothetical protein BT63DRAFT_423829 [Microthyrium microscopicum]|uniref:PAN2-PAN3 deadenylation complex catalytic subunit PAN2 n=1 Tax=Microthyrium microscopicum TaxID=703497 RepID=A0A6A6UG38_9PEZI|nr:hypothetical protein BT63DRAFT_423829 [Microthyrium microscopicum]